jgi:hypothetical protein
MKVIYKKTMLEKLQGQWRDARLQNKEIEKVILTVAETRQLLADCGLAAYAPGSIVLDYPAIVPWLWLVEYGSAPGPQPRFTVLGIDIEVER